MEKIKLKLCTGTLCYVMGGAQLMEIEEKLSEEEKERVEIAYSPCLQRCNGQEKPPLAEINGETVQAANVEMLIQIIKEKIRNAVR